VFENVTGALLEPFTLHLDTGGLARVVPEYLGVRMTLLLIKFQRYTFMEAEAEALSKGRRGRYDLVPLYVPEERWANTIKTVPLKGIDTGSTFIRINIPYR
jgi:hypothetical protein